MGLESQHDFYKVTLHLRLSKSKYCFLCSSATLNVAQRPCRQSRSSPWAPQLLLASGTRGNPRWQDLGPIQELQDSEVRPAWHCCLWLLTHSRWLRDERPQASWKINQAMHAARVRELSEQSEPWAAWWPGPIPTFPPHMHQDA